MWHFEDIEVALGHHFKNPSTGPISSIVIDTRELQKGDLFVALKGDRFDGHDFINDAVEKGAKALIIEDKSALPTRPPLPTIVVDNSREALVEIARYRRQRFTGTMIAITGSVGKTTTKNLVHLCLTPYGKVHCAKKSFNNRLGISLTLANLPTHFDYCICEIGMNHPGEIYPLACLVSPDIAIITTIGQAHIGHMGSLQAVENEKLSLLRALDPHGKAIIPHRCRDNTSLHHDMRNPDYQLFFAGKNSDDHIQFKNIHDEAGGARVSAKILHHITQFYFPSTAHYLAYDALLALGVCALAQRPLGKAIKALATFTPPSGRGKIYKLKNNIQLIDETYNASPQAMMASLTHFAALPAKRHIAILGDMGELGQFEADIHQKLAQNLPKNLNFIFCCGKAMYHFTQALDHQHSVLWKEHPQDLLPAIENYLQNGDIVLLKGSRFMHLECILTQLRSKDNI